LTKHPDNGRDRKRTQDDSDLSGATLRYVLSDFARGSYVVASLAINVFVVLQIYVSSPSFYSAFLVVLVLIGISYLEYRTYFRLKHFLKKDDIEGYDSRN
jgi:hypothetical protein